jgi:hypothetical protein
MKLASRRPPVLNLRGMACQGTVDRAFALDPLRGSSTVPTCARLLSRSKSRLACTKQNGGESRED